MLDIRLFKLVPYTSIILLIREHVIVWTNNAHEMNEN